MIQFRADPADLKPAELAMSRRRHTLGRKKSCGAVALSHGTGFVARQLNPGSPCQSLISRCDTKGHAGGDYHIVKRLERLGALPMFDLIWVRHA